MNDLFYIQPIRQTAVNHTHTRFPERIKQKFASVTSNYSQSYSTVRQPFKSIFGLV